MLLLFILPKSFHLHIDVDRIYFRAIGGSILPSAERLEVVGEQFFSILLKKSRLRMSFGNSWMLYGVFSCCY